ncbi:MAG: HD domain-containing protein [Cyclobacteriaceae bacterium]
MNTTSPLISTTVQFVQNTLTNAEAGHDWWHIQRVWKNAQHIAKKEAVDVLVVELAALLHDIADAKFHGGDEEVGPRTAQQFLEAQETAPEVVAHVVQIVRHVSFKGGNFKQSFHSPELAVVQDADRLDALGAIGIARTFHYGGFRNHPLYDPSVPPNLHLSKEEYKRSKAPTINHFYEKLLLLKDRMNTETGRQMAEERHRFMEQFLAQFYREWDGKNKAAEQK